AWGHTGNTLPARAAIVHHTLTPVPTMPAEDVAQFPPSSYPYLAFVSDAPWFVNTSGLPRDRVQAHRLWPRDPGPQHLQYRRSPTVERVLIMPLPTQSTDPTVLVTRTYVWALITGDLRQVGFTNPESCYLIFRDYIALAVHLRYIMAFTDAVLDCVCFMLPMAWRPRFTEDWAQVITISGQPPRVHWRRGM
ncbi:unnamed protein product, partial [Symbiodinium pilosum]